MPCFFNAHTRAHNDVLMSSGLDHHIQVVSYSSYPVECAKFEWKQQQISDAGRAPAVAVVGCVILVGAADDEGVIGD